ncbi:SEC-C metal-binding domain-containing protein [Paenibacillus sp. NEAU-GSW1]|uniref:SEC-C metal-binding domain-containing protein n=1 Tax=Paenibacillus sp. NEAU-GSW1 TaxID=2682486 RepID=UPI001C12AFA3|nr:SEC-C metal-binding domain-containing protein [Paenibacillus sp. NEAU-GSW1]
MSKIGRNEPCHCGSGNKYKKCCMAKDEQTARENRQQAAPATRMRSVEQGDLTSFITGQLNWNNSVYADLALELAKQLKDGFTPDQTAMTIMVWHTYANATNPTYRKAGVFLAALEYMACEVNGIEKSQTELAEKYDVSAATVSKRFQEISAFLLEQAAQPA